LLEVVLVSELSELMLFRLTYIVNVSTLAYETSNV